MMSDSLPRPSLDTALERLARPSPWPSPHEGELPFASALALWPDDPRGALGLVGCVAIVAASFAEFASWLGDHTPLLSHELELCVHATDRELSVRMVTAHASQRWREVACMVLMMRLVRTFAGGEAAALRASFSVPAPDNREPYVRLLGVAPRFGAIGGELVVAGELAYRPNPQADPALFEQLAGYARLALLRLRDEVPLGERVLALLRRDPTHVTMSMDEAAMHLGMSSRTLRRRLGDQGVSFGELKRQGLTHHARTLLSNPATSVKEAAYQLGYCDPSALNRAVRRAVGIAPSALRGWGRGH